MNDFDPVGLTSLLGLWGVVAFGAVVPVVPTGAAVSAAAVLAGHQHWWSVLVVVLVGGTGAYAGDLVTYGALRGAGQPLAVRVGWLDPDDPGTRLGRLREGIERHELRMLLVSRLVPGGRVPVLLVAALTGYRWTRFAFAGLAAAGLWACVYAAIGLVGSTLLPDTTTALVVAVAGALVLSVAPGAVRRLRARVPERVS